VPSRGPDLLKLEQGTYILRIAGVTVMVFGVAIAGMKMIFHLI